MKKIILGLSVLGCLYTINPVLAQTTTATSEKAEADKTSLAINSDFPMAHDLVNAVNDVPVNIFTEFKENGLLVVFTCNTCPYVVKAQPRTAEVIELARALNYGVVFINSNEAQRKDVDSKKAMKEYAKKHNYSTYLIDENSQYADLFGATKTPEVYLFNKERKLVYKGAMDDNPNNPQEVEVVYIQHALNTALTDMAIEPNTTKSIGCSIKRKK